MAVWAVLTEATLAVKEALEVPDATATLAGTVTALLLLDRATLSVAGAAELKDTVHEVDPEPVKVLVPHDRALTVGATAVPVPLRLTEALVVVLEIVNCPVTAPALVGSN